jgi:hypothetical protein
MAELIDDLMNRALTRLTPRFGGSYQLVGDLEFNAAVQGAIKRTVHGIGAVHFLDSIADVFWHGHTMVNEKAADNQNAVFCLNLAPHVADKSSPAGLYIPRCQRGGKCALQSSRSGGHYVVERRGTRLLDRLWIKAVMLGDCPVHAEVHWS